MKREIEISEFSIPWIQQNEWRAIIGIQSRVRDQSDEFFSARISVKIENYEKASPTEIKKEALKKLKDSLHEVIQALNEIPDAA